MGTTDPKWSRHYRHHERYLGHQGYLAMSLAAKGAHDLLCNLAGQAWGEDRRAAGSMTIGAQRRIRRNDAAKWLATKGGDMSLARAVLREIYDAGLAKDDRKDGAMILCEWIEHQVSDSRAARKKRSQRAGGQRRRGGDSGGDSGGDMSPQAVGTVGGTCTPYARAVEVEVERRDLSLSKLDSKSKEATEGLESSEASRPGPPGPPAPRQPSTFDFDFDRDRSPNPTTPHGTGPANGNGSRAEARDAEASSTSIRHGCRGAGGPGGPGRDWNAWAPDDPVNLASRLTGETGTRATNTWRKAVRDLGEDSFRGALAEVRAAAREGHAPNPGKLLNHVLRRKREDGT